jgi:putative transposase
VTFSCQRRLPLLGKPGARNVFVDSLVRARTRFGFRLHAWVVMPEHVHIILHPSGSISPVLQFIKQSVAQQIITRWKDLRAPILDRLTSYTGRPRFWQAGGGFDRNIRDENELLREIGYIHHNPVRRGLVRSPEDWEWSSVHWWMGVPNAPACDLPPGSPDAWRHWKGYK